MPRTADRRRIDPNLQAELRTVGVGGEPTISLAGEVIIRIGLEVSNIIGQVQSKQGSVAFQIGTRTAQTVLRLRDGESQVLAGLISDEDRSTRNKLPGMGELPVLGRLFGQHADNKSKTEIVLSITPRIVRSLQTPDAEQQTLDTGTENPSLPWPAPAPAALPEGSSATKPGPLPAMHRLAWRETRSSDDNKAGHSELVWLPSTDITMPLAMTLVLGFDPGTTQVLGVEAGPQSMPGSLSHRIDPAGRVLIQLQPVGSARPSTGGLAKLVWRSTAEGAPTPAWTFEQVVATGTEGSVVPVVTPQAPSGVTQVVRP